MAVRNIEVPQVVASRRQAARRVCYRRPVNAEAESAPTSEAPLPAAERIAALDVLRGVALFGIFIMNMPGFTHSVFTPPPVDASGLDKLVDTLRELLFAGKFNLMFGLLFGIGFNLQLGRLEAARDSARRPCDAGLCAAPRGAARGRPRSCRAALVGRRAGRLRGARLRAARHAPRVRRGRARPDRPVPALSGALRRLAAGAPFRSRRRPSARSSTRSSRPRTPLPSVRDRSSTRPARRRGSSPGATPRRSACSATPPSTCRWPPASCSAFWSVGSTGSSACRHCASRCAGAWLAALGVALVAGGLWFLLGGASARRVPSCLVSRWRARSAGRR